VIAQPLKVVILHDRAGEACDVSCGMDWSLPENRQLAAERLKERFGLELEAEYVEVSDPKAAQKYPEILEKLKKEKVPTPLLVINDAIRISGYFDIRMLVDMVEAEMEMED
jgi:disulfide oxidoreductase YuzD